MKKNLENVNKIHLIGAGGAGMSGLACLLQDKGFLVQGSDLVFNSKVVKLRERGIKVYIGHKKTNIDSQVNLVCYSSAVNLDNNELKEARKKNIKIIKRGKLLASLCENTKIIAVAGSHGKTTVVSLLSYLFKKIGYNPTVFIGGLPVDGSLPAVWGKDFSIVETDESDGTFLNYRPYLSIITNIDREHMNYYKNLANINKSFFSFAKNTKKKVFGCQDDLRVRKIMEKVRGVSFGLKPGSCFRAENIKLSRGFVYFDLYKKERFCLSFKSPLLGIHNCLNLLAVLAVCDYLGIDLKKVQKHLIKFKGTKRRLQVKGKFLGVTFIDDYAHHPTEIKATLEAAAGFGKKRLFAILEPHRPSRVKDLLGEFSQSLFQADLAVITDTYQACEKSKKGPSSLSLVKEVKNKGFDNVVYLEKSKLKSKVPKMIKKGDLVISMGAGDISKELEKIIYAFKKNKSEKKC